MSRRLFAAIAGLLILVTVVRVASTHQVFAQTIDEPDHLASGHEWLTQKRMHVNVEHPPLAQALIAWPFVDTPTTHPDDAFERGNDLLARDDRYIHNLAAARRPILVFLVVAMVAVALLAWRYFGETVACLALASFALLPPVLAHAGLATADMAGTAGFAVALYALLVWCDAPTWRRTLLLGLAIGFGTACKYSFIPFFGAALVIMLIVRRRFQPVKLLAAFAIAFVFVWAVFRFEVGTMRDANPRAVQYAERAIGSSRIVDLPLPTPLFFLGVLRVKAHNTDGHHAYLFGEVSADGWWYYFPVAFAVKTPIPYLLLVFAGAWLLVRRKLAPELLLVPLAILLISMTTRINIGVRHLLPMYIPLSIVAGYALFALRQRLRIAAVVAAGWLLIGSALAHPDYLPWMNAFAGRHPERVLLDSNFDWGQDIWRLARVARQRGIDHLGYRVWTNVRGSSVGITSGSILDPHQPSSGWNIVSEHSLGFARAADPGAYRWLTDGRDFERIGKTLRLYSVSPHSVQRRRLAGPGTGRRPALHGAPHDAFEPPPGAKKLCSGHVTGAPRPDGQPGPHINWTAYTSRKSPDSLAKRYLQSHGTTGHAQEGGCHIWRRPSDKPREVLEICGVEKAGPWNECADPPPAGAKSIIMISSITGR